VQDISAAEAQDETRRPLSVIGSSSYSAKAASESAEGLRTCRPHI
jgi:hypothetical protein